MNQSNTFHDINQMIASMPVISSHEHHLPDHLQKNMTLDSVLDFSYVGWFAGRKNKPLAASPLDDPLLPDRMHPKIFQLPSDDPELDADSLYQERRQFLDRFGYNSYWVWLEKGIQKIYKVKEEITPENWDSISTMIAENHRAPDFHLEAMRSAGHYLHAVQDTYWEYSSDLGHPQFFSPTMRTDMFITSCHPSVLDHDLNSPFIHYPNAPTDNFGDYLDFVKHLFVTWRNKGAVAMKCASAYERTLLFDDVSQEEAQKIFFRSADEISSLDRLVYGNFMFDWFCRLNLELEIPFQIHTGLASISGSNPMLFEPILRRFPKNTFVLFHAGYPWYTEIAGLAHNYDNVVIDMVWAPLISTTGATQALKEYIEIARSSDLITWGGDTWTSEEAVGAVLAWKYVVSKVLAEMVDSGYIPITKVDLIAKKLMFQNNAKLYNITV